MNSSMVSLRGQEEAGQEAAMPLGSVLVKLGKLRAEDVERVADAQRQQGKRFGEAALSLGLVSEADLQRGLAEQFDFPYLLRGESDLAMELVAAYEPWSEQVEMMRNVRSELLLRWFGAGRRSLAVASLNSGDGASLFVANLALLFAQMGKKTLVIDANLRNPRQRDIFALQESAGLTDLLVGRVGADAAVPVPCFPGLSVLGAGTLPPNPQELIAGSRFTAVEALFAPRNEVILLDTPALSAGADALHLAAHAGGILLLVRKDEGRMDVLQDAAAKLARMGIAIVGSVLLEF